jgi:hypothetical protein
MRRSRALRALGETAGTAEDAEHAETCPYCRSELARRSVNPVWLILRAGDVLRATAGQTR